MNEQKLQRLVEAIAKDCTPDLSGLSPEDLAWVFANLDDINEWIRNERALLEVSARLRASLRRRVRVVSSS